MRRTSPSSPAAVTRFLAALGLFLAGVTGLPSTRAVQAAPSARVNPVTLQVLIGYGDEKQVSSTLKAQFQRFEATHPGVHVELIYSGGGYIDQKLQTTTAAGMPPDLIFMWSFQFASFARSDFFLPLETYVDNQYLSRFFPDFVTYGRLGGHLYGLPITGGPASIMYHPDQFDSAGVTPPSANDSWDDFVRKAKALTRDKNGDGNPDQWGFVWYEVVIRDWMTWIWRNGGDIFSPDLRQFTLDEAPAAEAIQFLADLSNKYKVCPPEPVLWGTPWDLFNKGQASMYAEGAWSIDGLRKHLVPQDTAPLPKRKNEATALEAYYLAVHRASQHVPEAVELAKFLAGDSQSQIAINEWGFGIPAVAQVAKDVLQAERNKWNIATFLDPLVKGVTRMMPYPPNWGPVQDTIRAAFRKAFSGQASARQVAQEVKGKIEALITQTKS
ncbi:MAG: sugar ABC transporter substrate-binding protein [Limnochordaceae bacterium]|nr:sugar ABC transporter substrate-binding protein [Limnochordaceae bacterium]